MSRFLLLFIAICSAGTTWANSDIDKIKEVCNLYITSITDYSKNIDVNNSYENLLYGVFDYDSDVYIHQNDLFDTSYANKNDIDNYLAYIDIEYQNSIDIEFEETEVLDCTSNLNGRYYVFAIVLKTLKYKDKTREQELIFGLYKEGDGYIVEYALFNTAHNNTELMVQCSVNSIEEDRLKLEREHLKSANAAFADQNYFNAKRLYEMVLSFNPSNTYAIDGVRNCNLLLTKERTKIEIANLIQHEKFREAEQRLAIFEREFPSTETAWVLAQKNASKNGIALKNYQANLKIANAKYDAGLFEDAINYYKSARSYSVADIAYIDGQIERCETGSPQEVMARIKKAYNEAKYSKSKWLNTYRTYIKYQNSGVLNGENYYFMCLMMENNYSQIGKKMGYSRRQTRQLAVKYFYKAKELGRDVSFLETQVFTKRRTKKKK